jgi:hypothetical protein
VHVSVEDESHHTVFDTEADVSDSEIKFIFLPKAPGGYMVKFKSEELSTTSVDKENCSPPKVWLSSAAFVVSGNDPIVCMADPYY